MHCRRALVEEARALEAIRRDAILDLAAPILGDEYAAGWVDSAEPDRVSGAIETNDVWVVEGKEEVVGWIEVDGNRICALYVRPNSSRCGVGSSLLHHAENRVRSAGFDIVALEATVNAESFYEERGYRPLQGKDRTDVLHMFKVLSGRTDVDA